jgi:hypothetical protein
MRSVRNSIYYQCSSGFSQTLADTELEDATRRKRRTQPRKEKLQIGETILNLTL